MATMKTSGFESFEEFWPFYLGEHAQPTTRGFHYVGTGSALLVIIGAVAGGAFWLLPAALVAGYGPAWVSHFFIEKNKPASFKHPFWSFRGDFRMLGYFLTGRIGGELAKWNIGARVAPAT